MRFARFIALALIAIVVTSSLQLEAQDRRGPFTHPPRSVRSRDVDQEHLRLELKFDWDKQRIEGRAEHALTALKQITELTLDAADMKINSVRLHNDDASSVSEELTFKTRGDALIVQLGRQISSGDTIRLTIDYTVEEPQSGVHFVVPDESEPDQPKMVWTQSEPEYARYWFPCIDSPSDRLTSEIIATVPDDFFVLSNGLLHDTRKNGDGTQTWHWVQKKSHVPYLMSVVAGDFEAYEQEWAGIPIVSYVPRGRLADAPRSFEKTPHMMQFFSERIGHAYPWPKYAQICVDEYMWGGMEHTSATTLNLNTLHDERAHLDVSSDNLVAHELVHQWWGDLLTCKDWAELWLNESFATYFATLWTEHDEGWDEATWARHDEANDYLAEDKRYRRPIVTYRYNQPGNMFDRHSYPKGGRVLHMLRFELGDELFWRAINRYCEVNQHRTVETADLRIAVEEATGQGMNWFFDQWIYHGGHPEFDVSWNWDDTARSVTLVVKQTQKADEMTPLFRTSVEIELVTPEETTIRRVTVSKAEETFHFPLQQRPTRVCVDPNDWVLKTLTFEKSKEELLDQLANDEHIMCRARAAEALAEQAKHDDVRAALIEAAKSDSFWAVRQEAVQALAKFKGDAVRRALVEAAKNDEKSLVRREAIKALRNFAHDETNAALRHVIQHDPSYYAVAEALKALTQVDRKNCAAELLAAIDTPSHREVILKAACDGLVSLKHSQADDRLRAMLDEPLSPERRVVLIGALARLKTDNSESRQALYKQLDNDRVDVRRHAVDALVDLADPAAIDVLLAHRNKEQSSRMVRTIDEAIEKLRDKQNDVERLRKDVDSLRQENRSLEERLKKLEGAAQ